MKGYDLNLVFPRVNQTIRTSSTFLANQSPVFQKLIYEDPLKPKTEIFLGDDPCTAYQALECLHTLGRSLTSFRSAALIRNFGMKYQMKNLCNITEKYIMLTLSPDNVGEIYDLACRFAWCSIQYFCWIMFDISWKEIFSSTSFYRCSGSAIVTLVSRPKYIDLDEFFLWNAVYTWGLTKIYGEASFSCTTVSHREALKDYLPHIRFLTMKKEELKAVFNCNILTVEECKAIEAAYESHDVSNLPPMLCRSTLARTSEMEEHLTSHIRSLFCIKHTIQRWVKADDTFYSEFTVRNNCFLTGITLPLCTSLLKVPLRLYLQMTKKSSLNETKYECASKYLQLFSPNVNLFPPIFIRRNWTICINAVIIKDNISCQIAPYASCHIGNTPEDVCRNAEEWKQFYVKDVLLYF